MPQGGSGQVAQGVFSSSEHIAPQEFTFGPGFIELARKSCATGVGRVETRRERASSVRVSYSAQIGWLGVPKEALK